MNQPTPPQENITIHACFSGSLACSGCNPCKACLKIIETQVIPRAMVWAGLNQSPEMARAFFSGWVNAWTELHQRMNNSPPGSFQAVDMSAFLELVREAAAQVQGQAQVAQEPAAEDPNIMAPPAAPEPVPQPQASEEDTTLLGPDRDLMGPMDAADLARIMEKARLQTSPVESTQPAKVAQPALRPEEPETSTETTEATLPQQEK